MIFTLVLIALTCLFLWIRKTFSFFRSQGIAEDPGYFPFGSKSSWKLLFTQIAFLQLTDEVNSDFPDEKIIGSYGPMGQRAVIVKDMELIRHVLIKDFDHFVDRRHIVANPKANKYFVNMLTVMTGDKWKQMRNIISPVFTSGKLKSMMPIIHKVGDDFVAHLQPLSKDQSEFDAKDVMTSYTLDVIASAGLGIEANSFADREGIFRKRIDMLIGANNADPYGVIRVLLMLTFPTLSSYFNVAFLNKTAMDFIVEVIRSSVKLRMESKEKKNDLIDTLIETLKNYKDESDGDGKSKSLFTEEEIESALVSNALLLFLAGFDTSSSSMAIVSYFLAKNPDIQERLYNEVQEAIVASNNDQRLGYNVVQDLPYLEQIIHESLRIYPFLFLERQCVKDYKVPGIDFVIRKGDIVQIPSPSIMRDPKHFDNPTVFNPDNFSAEKKAQRNQYAYMSFGQGPRNCIGMRFALLQVKTAIVRLVANYEILECSKTVKELIPDPFSRSFIPKGGIWIKVKQRNSTM